MRLPLISPSDLTSEQRAVYEDMRAGIEQNFQGFSSIAENGALMGPWNPQAVQAFGVNGAAELIYLVGLYCLVSVTLNGFDVPVPEPNAT